MIDEHEAEGNRTMTVYVWRMAHDGSVVYRELVRMVRLAHGARSSEKCVQYDTGNGRSTLYTRSRYNLRIAVDFQAPGKSCRAMSFPMSDSKGMFYF